MHGNRLQSSVASLFNTTIDLELKLHSEAFEAFARELTIVANPLPVNMLKAVSADNSVLMFQVSVAATCATEAERRRTGRGRCARASTRLCSRSRDYASSWMSGPRSLSAPRSG